jgi:uncharacterized protein
MAPTQPAAMSEAALAAFIQQQIDARLGDEVQFSWQNDEPALSGLGFFRRVVALQQRYGNGKRIDNVFQTNGDALTDDQCRFFKAQGWRVVVSIEGPSALQERATEMLTAHEVAFRLQVVVSRHNCVQPQTLYRYLRSLGTPFLDFTPRLAMNDRHVPDEHSVPAKAWGEFLHEVFDVWVREDIGRIFVQLFDSTLAVWNGFSSRNGTPNERGDEVTLSEKCRACPVLRLCNGDSPDHRDASGKSVLCEGYLEFFNYTSSYMKVMRDLIRHHRSPMELMVMLNQQKC